MFLWLFIPLILILFFYDKIDLSKKSNFKQILDERLAKGEITIEEYNKIKKARE